MFLQIFSCLHFFYLRGNKTVPKIIDIRRLYTNVFEHNMKIFNKSQQFGSHIYLQFKTICWYNSSVVDFCAIGFILLRFSAHCDCLVIG